MSRYKGTKKRQEGKQMCLFLLRCLRQLKAPAGQNGGNEAGKWNTD